MQRREYVILYIYLSDKYQFIRIKEHKGGLLWEKTLNSTKKKPEN